MDYVYSKSPGFLIGALSRLYQQALQARMNPHGVTAAQFPVLLSLWQQDGQTQSNLCRQLRVEQPTLANTLNRMVRDKLVRKVKDTNDRRQTIIKLTEQGRALQPLLTTSALELHRTMTQGMQSADAAVRLFLTKMINNLETDLNADPLLLEEVIEDEHGEDEPLLLKSEDRVSA